ncbi:MAG: type II secretion system F family protein [Leifsonia sp.]
MRRPARRARWRPRRRRPPGAEADRVAALAESLAVMLDAGLSPRTAWSAAADHGVHPAAVSVLAGLQQDGDSCAAALARAATTDDVRSIATVWSVAEVSGAPLGHALRTIAETLRDAAEAEREADVALSGPRATARLVSWLPAGGALLAVAVGADLAGTAVSPAGAVTLGGGALLMLAGRWWMRGLVRRATARRPHPGLAEELIAIALSGGASAEAGRRLAKDAAAGCGLAPPDDDGARATLGLAAATGVPAVELLTASARQRRRSARAEARSSAAALGVRLMVPLGVCVLPSFLLLAVAPLLLSLLSSTAEGWR